MHPGVQISAVYYVDDGGSHNEGVRFVDPRPQASMVPVPAWWTRGTGEHIRVQSVPGLFVLFPAWVQHYVVAHAGDRPRISVSFNVRLTFPEEEQLSVSAQGLSSPAELSFTVPQHHQKAFLNTSLSRDMIVN